MDTNLAMNSTKTSSSFSVKDLLDLPEAKVARASPRDGEGLDLSTTVSVAPAAVHGMSPVTPYFDNTDNPYTRWLQTNETAHYAHSKFKWYLVGDDVIGYILVESSREYHASVSDTAVVWGFEKEHITPSYNNYVG